jgi:hypothetical protein
MQCSNAHKNGIYCSTEDISTGYGSFILSISVCHVAQSSSWVAPSSEACLRNLGMKVGPLKSGGGNTPGEGPIGEVCNGRHQTATRAVSCTHLVDAGVDAP